MGKRVLLIEDEPNIVEAVSFLLSRDGLTVHTHPDGATALDKIRNSQPDMVILDVMLPGRSGYDVLRDLRTQGDYAALPVMVLTARGQARDREMAQHLGATRFMTKPFANADLRAAVRDMVGA